MSRFGFTLVVGVALAAWAGAQGPPPAVTAADRVRMLRADRTLLADLVESGVKLGGADHPVARAESCQETARLLGIALHTAAEGQDADRVGELGDHLDRVVRDGLVPLLDEARRTTPPESPDAKRLGAVRESAAGDLEWALSAVPPAGKLADSARVTDVAAKLDRLRERLRP